MPAESEITINDYHAGSVSQKTLSPLVILSNEKTMVAILIRELNSVTVRLKRYFQKLDIDAPDSQAEYSWKH